MKKKLLLLTCLIVAICAIFAISASAAADDYFDEVEIIDNNGDGVSDIAMSDTLPFTPVEGVIGTAEARVCVSCTCEAQKHTFPAYYVCSKQDGATFYRLEFSVINTFLSEYCGNTTGLKASNVTALEVPNGFTKITGNFLYDDGTFLGTAIKYVSFAKISTIATKDDIITNSGKNWVSGSPIEEIDFGTLAKIPVWFANGCTSLVSVDIPDSVTNIDVQAFYGCTSLTTVNISKTSQLKSLSQLAFGSCSSLKALYLPDSLETLNLGGNNNGPFNGCSSLYFVNEPGTTEKPSVYYFPENLSDVSGEAIKNCGSLNSVLVFGTNVTSLNNAWAFQSSPTIVVFLGDMKAINTSTWNVSKVIFVNANDKSSADIASYTNSKTTVFCASESDESKHLESPRDSEITEATCYSNEFVTKHCFCGKQIGEKTETPDSMIDHEYVDDFDCTTANYCKNYKEEENAGCKAFLVADASEHAETHDVIFENGFTSAGVHNTYCANATCKVLDKVEDLDAMFTHEGYSFKAGALGGIDTKFKINTEAVILYEQYEGTIHFGIIIANASHFENVDVFIENGTLTSTNAQGDKSGIMVEMTSREYNYFSCHIDGFDFNNEKHTALGLIIAGYVYGEDESNIAFIQKQYTTDSDDNTLETPYTATVTKGETVSVVNILAVRDFVPIVSNDDE